MTDQNRRGFLGTLTAGAIGATAFSQWSPSAETPLPGSLSVQWEKYLEIIETNPIDDTVYWAYLDDANVWESERDYGLVFECPVHRQQSFHLNAGIMETDRENGTWNCRNCDVATHNFKGKFSSEESHTDCMEISARGCGDAVQFVAMVKQITWADAVFQLAARGGVQLKLKYVGDGEVAWLAS